ncbi:MAG: hypothetical protein KDC26_07360 [Armatimonadetes bacterium]|nr:hypothetical protein [Armatimonadota bacterium]
MLQFLAQATPPETNFWQQAPGTTGLILGVVGAFIIGMLLFFGLSTIPTQFRRYIIVGFTFLAGLVFVLQYLWPRPINADFEKELPRNAVEGFGAWLGVAIDPVAKTANILAAFLLGLGIFSLMRVHINKIRRRAQDWGFSLILIVSSVIMAIFGFWDWNMRQFNDPEALLTSQENWKFANYVNDALFDGMYQQMDAAMFSMIAFFILSAAYRAFRIRSVEATVMMASALILMLNLMGALTFMWSGWINGLVESTGNQFLTNFDLTVVAGWLRANMQIPAIRAIEFGVGLGALAMGLRLWLGLEKGGVSS